MRSQLVIVAALRGASCRLNEPENNACAGGTQHTFSWLAIVTGTINERWVGDASNLNVAVVWFKIEFEDFVLSHTDRSDIIYECTGYAALGAG